MDVLRPLNDPDSVFMLFTKRLTLAKFHELLNKVQEFVASLRDEDVIDNTMKELTVKRDPNRGGIQTVLLNYHMPPPKSVPQQHPNPVSFTKPAEEPFIQQQQQNLSFEPLPTKKIKMDQQLQNDMGNQPIMSDNGSYSSKYPVSKPEPPKQNYQEYEEYEHPKDNNWKTFPTSATNQLNSINIAPSPKQNFSNPFRPNQNIQMMDPQQGPTNRNMGGFQEDMLNLNHNEPVPSFHSDTPKFPNQYSIAACVNKIWEESPYLQEMSEMPEKEKTKSYNSKPYPVFESTFLKLDPPNFYLDNVKPGLVSKKLAQALGMASEKEAPPYLSKLIKVGIAGPYREETFYGINTKVPKDFDKESWAKAGVPPQFLEGETKVTIPLLIRNVEKEVNVIQEDTNKNTAPTDGPKILPDQEYLNRFLRKPQTYFTIQSGGGGSSSSTHPFKPIEID